MNFSASCMNDLYVTPRFSWSFCDFRKKEALTPQFEANALLAPLPRFTGQIRLRTLEYKVFAVNRARPKQLMSYNSPHKFLLYVTLYYRILGASLMRQLPHCLVFPDHFATSGKTRPSRPDFEANASLASLPHFSGSLITPN